MPAVAFTEYYCFAADPYNGKHNLASDTLKLKLTNNQPVLTHTTASQVVEIAAGGGYPAGGFTLNVVSSQQTAGLYRFILQDFRFTATTDIPTWRWGSIYNSTSPTTPVIGYMTYPVPVNMLNGEDFDFDFDGVNGLFSLNLYPTP